MLVINYVDVCFSQKAVKLVRRNLHGDHAHEVVEIVEDHTVPAEELFLKPQDLTVRRTCWDRWKTKIFISKRWILVFVAQCEAFGTPLGPRLSALIHIPCIWFPLQTDSFLCPHGRTFERWKKQTKFWVVWNTTQIPKLTFSSTWCWRPNGGFSRPDGPRDFVDFWCCENLNKPLQKSNLEL